MGQVPAWSVSAVPCAATTASLVNGTSTWTTSCQGNGRSGSFRCRWLSNVGFTTKRYCALTYPGISLALRTFAAKGTVRVTPPYTTRAHRGRCTGRQREGQQMVQALRALLARLLRLSARTYTRMGWRSHSLYSSGRARAHSSGQRRAGRLGRHSARWR